MTMKNTLTLKEIKALMQPDKTPVVITPREPQPPSTSEEIEVYGRDAERMREMYLKEAWLDQRHLHL